MLAPNQRFIMPPSRDNSTYDGVAVVSPRRSFTPQEQLALLDIHPLFTGRCPACEHPIGFSPQTRWHCHYCHWLDDSKARLRSY